MVERVMNMPNNKKESNNRFIFDDLESISFHLRSKLIPALYLKNTCFREQSCKEVFDKVCKSTN